MIRIARYFVQVVFMATQIGIGMVVNFLDELRYGK